MTVASCPNSSYSLDQCPPADPSILIEADGQESSRKGLKSIAWPELDTDALESSIAVRVMGCIGKWQLKLEGVAETASPGQVQPVEPDEQSKDPKQATLARHPQLLNCELRTCPCSQSIPLEIPYPASHPRLGQEALSLAELLGQCSVAIAKTNENGIVSGGFTKA